ncbi:MAG: hypothetical protein RKE49_01800 [Oceanicaulis sp.]
MTAMTMEFDGVRELSVDEVDAVMGGARGIAIVRTAVALIGLVARGGSGGSGGSGNTNNGDVDIEIEGDLTIQGNNNCIGVCQES